MGNFFSRRCCGTQQLPGNDLVLASKGFWWELETLEGFEAVLWFVHCRNTQETSQEDQRPPGL